MFNTHKFTTLYYTKPLSTFFHYYFSLIPQEKQPFIQPVKFIDMLIIFEHKESRQTVIYHKSVGSASYVRLTLCSYFGFSDDGYFEFFKTSIKFSCLHLGQKRGNFFILCLPVSIISSYFRGLGNVSIAKFALKHSLFQTYFLKISTAWLVTPNKSSRSQIAK